MEEQSFFIKGSIYSAAHPQLQDALVRIYGTPERPRCMCVRGGVEMYVAKHRLFVVKRMPETGQQHDPLCPSYEPDLAHSGLGELINNGLVNRSPDLIELSVDFPLARLQSRTTTLGERQDRTGVSAHRHRMSLRAVMHLLFERAGMNRWYPAMEGKRNQGVLHKYITEAAEEVITKGLKLSERLYVPEPFSEPHRAEVAGRRRSKLAILESAEGDAKYNMALLLGEFKTSEAAINGRRIWVKHMPDVPLLVDGKTWQRIERVYAELFEARDADTARRPRLVICALIYAKREHTYQVDTATFMLTTDQWIPIEGLHELDLICGLTQAKRCFIKPLRYDTKTTAQFPSALLLDAHDKPIPLHVMSTFIHEKVRGAKEKALKGSGGLPWVWYTDKPMPSLPEARKRQASAGANRRP